MRRCTHLLDDVNIVAVCHALVTHMLLAATVIVGISVSWKVETDDESTYSDYTYLYITVMIWQEHVAYLLLAHISVIPSSRSDTAIIYIVVTWGMSASPASALSLPYFQKDRHKDCAHSIWQPHSDDVHRESVVISVSVILALLLVTSIYHMAKVDTVSRQIKSTCKHCSECEKMRVTVRGLRFIRVLIAQFLLIAIPQVVFWAIVLHPKSDGKDYEWVILSVQGSLGMLAGFITLVLQWRLLSFRIIPCTKPINITRQHGTLRLSRQEEVVFPSLKDDANSPAGYVTVVKSRSGQLHFSRTVNCQCAHCVEHKTNADDALAKKMAVQAAATFGKMAAKPSLPSLRRKDSQKRRKSGREASIPAATSLN
ncbi:uncharacterized protein LOC143284207 [Babylonia areolata]|uniref:uncharacterized protein LOC143284207 n=1 Tax=Babylonia areolata TaxID=304850 RepID=UPI003FD5C39E